MEKLSMQTTNVVDEKTKWIGKKCIHFSKIFGSSDECVVIIM